MPIQVFQWDKAIRELRTEWAALVSSSGANPSLHPDWMNITVAAHGMAGQSYVIVVKTPGGDSAFVPVVMRRVSVAGVPMRCLDLCSNVMSYHAGLVATGAHEQVLAELLTSKSLPSWDVFRFGNLVTTSATAIAMASFHSSRRFVYGGERSPYIDMSQTWHEYLAELPKKVRANIKGCIRSTQQAGETGMAWFEEAADTDRLLSDILAIESRSWKAADNKAIKEGAVEGAYYARLLPWLAQHGLMANVLYINHLPAAYVLCAKWQGWVGQLKTSYAQDVRDAGFRVIHASIEHAYGQQQREYDFLGDAAPHKLRWTDRIREHEDRWIFAGHWRGRALASLKQRVDSWRNKRRPPAQVNE